MTVYVSRDSEEMARAAAADATAALRQAVDERGEARLIVATGASQFGFLQALTQAPDIAWPQVTAFHLDEYVGLPVTHRASFRAYLRQRFAGALPAPLCAFVEVDGHRQPGGDRPDQPEDHAEILRAVRSYALGQKQNCGGRRLC